MGEWLEDMEGGGSPGMHGSMIYGHLWSELIPATRPACCISEQRHSPGGTAGGMNDPEVIHLHKCTHSHMHFLIMWQFISVCLVSNKHQWAARASDGHVTHSLVTILEVKANRESDKEEKEVVPLWVHKNWVKRDMFLLAQSPNSFLFVLQCAELSGEIYCISSRLWMETDFYHPLQFTSLSPVVSPMMTSLFE